MAKIHENGGRIGRTVDYNSTDTYTNGSSNKKNSGVWGLDSAVKSAPTPSYDSLILDFGADEGSNARWVLYYSNVPVGTTVGYTLSGTGITASDFTSNSLTGTLTLNSGTGSVLPQVFASSDQLSEGNETITITLDSTDSAGNPTGSLSNSDAVISDTSRETLYGVNFVSDSTPNEGSQFYIEWYVTSGIYQSSPGTMYWSINGTTSDFDVTSGSMALWSGPTTIGLDRYWYYRTYITPTADSLTEGSEVYTVSLRTGSTSGTVRATQNITVQDTSTAPVVSYSYFSGPSSIDEGSSGVFEFRVANSGEPMHYTISPAYASDMASANPSDGGECTYLGTTTIGNDTFYRHQVTLNAVADTTTEGAEAYTLYFRSGGDVGPIRAQASFTINDTSTTPAASSGSELSGVLMTRSGQYSTNSWEQNVTVDLSPYVGSTGRLVFYYETTTSYTADLQLDNVNLNGTTYNFNSSADGFETTTADTNSAGLETTAHYESLSFTEVATGTSGNRWNRDSGGTPSSVTGLTIDADGATGGFYLYPETSVSHPASYWLRSPEVTLTTGTCDMAIARYGSTMGTINAYWYGTPLPSGPDYAVLDPASFQASPGQTSVNISQGAVKIGGATGLDYAYVLRGSSSTTNIRAYAFDPATYQVGSLISTSPTLNFLNGQYSRALDFNADGTKLYVAGASAWIFEWDLSTAWDITTIAGSSTASKQMFTTASTIPNWESIQWSPDGLSLYAATYSSNDIYKYTTSTPYYIAGLSQSSSFDTSFNQGATSGYNLGVYVSSDETQMIVFRRSSNTLYYYTMSTPGNLSTCSLDGSVSLSNDANFNASQGNYRDMDISISDGSYAYAVFVGGSVADTIRIPIV